MASKPVMIFHVPFRLNPEAKSASGIRPVKMRRAFEDAGFEVREVSGRHPERRAKIRQLKQQIADGLKVDFVYSEAATTPTGLGEPVTLATSVSRDVRFLQYCQRSGIPVGLFYRDVYWRFPIYDELVKRPISTVLRALYRHDLRGYRRAKATIYLPSIVMSKWVPIVSPDRFAELPPGCTIRDAADPTEQSTTDQPSKLSLLYVGGLGNNYRMHETVRQVAGRADVEFVICTREAEWEQREPEYRDVFRPNIRVVHASGDELDDLYAEADVCMLAVEPISYWEFAVPMKMLEYTGYGKPIIASKNTYSATFVERNDLGWVVNYGSAELPELLDRLTAEPDLVSEQSAHVREVRELHTWEARARQVARDLSIGEII